MHGRSTVGYDSWQYEQKRILKNLTPDIISRRGVGRVCRQAVCTGDMCGEYDGGQCVHKRFGKGTGAS